MIQLTMQKPVLNKLSQDIVNKIAAGEVVERPASVVKELLDNSIDAKADEVKIRINEGGISLIEISDNGVGVPSENLDSIFDAHTTTKLRTIEDLNNLLSMGFRGEALSTIVSVADVSMSSKFEQEDTGKEISFLNGQKGSVKTSAKERGTTVKVENIFGNVPARKKFLKTPQTEYRKILDTIVPYFLIYPNISFELIKDGKTVYDLKAIPNSKAGRISKERVEETIKGEYTNRMFELFYDGGGMNVNGYIGHPSDHLSRTSEQYIFVNNRHIQDRGIIRGVIEGYSRYIPHGQKVPFVISIHINPDLIDVNVHPRKEEVRFLNPYRVYSGVEEAVKKSIEKGVRGSYEAQPILNPLPKAQEYQEYKNRDINFKKDTNSSIKDSLLFSKEILNNTGVKHYDIPDENIDEKPRVFQIFNKYIVAEFIPQQKLWIIDQHAAAERITFEKLKKGYKETDIQNLLLPIEITLGNSTLEFFDEYKQFFKDIGFDIKIDNQKIYVNALPTEFQDSDLNKLFEEVLDLTEDKENTQKNIQRLKEDILATMACHGSVRAGQKLSYEEMLDIYQKLMECDNPYSCPHGRPAIWRLNINEIDSNFERTY